MRISIIGGGGRVGLPLAIALAREQHQVVVIDKDTSRVKKINERIMPFHELGAEDELKKIPLEYLEATDKDIAISDSEVCILVIGTPVLDDGTPTSDDLVTLVSGIIPNLKTVKLLMLRSTIYPGLTIKLQKVLNDFNLDTKISYCPERIAEGSAMEELYKLPQIIGADDAVSQKISSKVFEGISSSIVFTSILEAELTKLFANSYRYIKFAIANEFFKIAADSGASWEKIWQALKLDYPRAADIPLPGFAAGPCLVKDTIQLHFFAGPTFKLGKIAIEINEEFPDYLVSYLEQNYDLSKLTIGILGMTFKQDVDDFRSSLSFRLRRILIGKAKKVLCSDPLLTKSYFVGRVELIENSDIIIIATPHKEYSEMIFDQPVVDIWRISSSKSLI